MKKGVVYLIGAGPGDPGLITLKGKEILESCDAWFMIIWHQKNFSPGFLPVVKLFM